MAETTIFANSYNNTQSITAAGAVVTWARQSGAASIVPLVMTQLAVNYQRSLAPIFPINVAKDNTRRQIVVAGTPSGTLTCGGIITPDMGDLTEFLTACGVSCGSDLPTITVRPFSDETCGSKASFILTGVQLVSLSMSQQAGAASMVSLPLQFMFTELKFSL